MLLQQLNAFSTRTKIYIFFQKNKVLSELGPQRIYTLHMWTCMVECKFFTFPISFGWGSFVFRENLAVAFFKCNKNACIFLTFVMMIMMNLILKKLNINNSRKATVEIVPI